MLEEKKCPEGEKWWEIKGKCVPVETQKKMRKKMMGDE
jgi:hypothetical protein